MGNPKQPKGQDAKKDVKRPPNKMVGGSPGSGRRTGSGAVRKGRRGE